MSRGKYSPCLPTANMDCSFFDRNAKGAIPPERGDDEEYNEEIHYSDFDPDGFDRYGYSCYLANGKYVGNGNGVDRLGHTEMEYLTSFTDEEFFHLC